MEGHGEVEIVSEVECKEDECCEDGGGDGVGPAGGEEGAEENHGGVGDEAGPEAGEIDLVEIVVRELREGEEDEDRHQDDR